MNLLNVVIKIDVLYKLLIKKIHVSKKMWNIKRKQKDNEKHDFEDKRCKLN